MKFSLPPLPYAFDALEPHLDARTMEIHYTKHHQTYLDKFNAVLEKYPDLHYNSAEEVIKNLIELPVKEEDRQAIANFGGGFINHNIFWQSMSSQKQIDENLIREIEITFGSLEEFKTQFTKLALGCFGSGWAWLVKTDSALKMYTLPNQDSPHSIGHTPIFTIDLWEHAYYLKFQNKRNEFIENWWNVLKFF